MKKQAVVCDVCNKMISTNLKSKDRFTCAICNRDMCDDCGSNFLEDIFDDRISLCEKCNESIENFTKHDYDILQDKYSKELLELIKKLMMTNEMRGNKQ